MKWILLLAGNIFLEGESNFANSNELCERKIVQSKLQRAYITVRSIWYVDSDGIEREGITFIYWRLRLKLAAKPSSLTVL
jgi:hypothetical protein